MNLNFIRNCTRCIHIQKLLILGFVSGFLCGLLGLTSCSYHVGHYKRSLPGGYSLVAVSLFKNKTHETGAESYFTAALRDEIERSHQGSVVDQSHAQVLIEGEIQSIKYNHGAQVTRDTPGFESLPQNAVLTKEYRIYADMKVTVIRASDRKPIWSGQFTGERRYPAPQVLESVINTVDPLYNHSAHHQNLKLVARDLAAEAYDRMTENF